MIRLKRKFTLFAISVMIVSLILGIGVINVKRVIDVNAQTQSAYVELYAPTDEVTVSTTDSVNFVPAIADSDKTESGKALALNYKVTSSSVSASIPMQVERKINDFAGLAMWINIPNSVDEYSFTLRIENNLNTMQYLRANKTLLLIDQDGVVREQTTVAKRLYLNGFTGWLMIPKTAFIDPVPQVEYEYLVSVLIESNADANAKRTENFSMQIGSLGYYTEAYSFIVEKAGETSLTAYTLSKLNSYIAEVELLEPEDTKQLQRKSAVLNQLNTLKNTYASLSIEEKISTIKGLNDEYISLREDYLYGDVSSSNFIMSFAIMSDTHFSSTVINSNFTNALQDARKLNPDLAGAFVLGDLSDQGVSLTDPSYSDLDNYYDWLDSYEYKNSKGQDIPITNILGNHDVRGSSGASDGRKPASYDAAVALYKEREGVENINFDKWINGYHFIFLNTEQYHKDDCYFSAETLTWLDKTLGENEDGRPIFVMVHQPTTRIHELEGATMTFKEVIARHPTAIVSSGHTHSAFGTASIVQDGNGNYINQPGMKDELLIQYYFVEVYEDGVVFKARELGTDSWKLSSYVVVRNDDIVSKDLFSADIFEGNLSTESVSASIVSAETASGNAVKLVGVNEGTVVIPANAGGVINNYAGYALFVKSETPISLDINGVKLKSNAKYYVIENRKLVTKTVSANGEITANGYVILPKECFDGACAPDTTTTLSVKVGAGKTIYVDKISYYFDFDEFTSPLADKVEDTNPTDTQGGCKGSVAMQSTIIPILSCVLAYVIIASRKGKRSSK